MKNQQLSVEAIENGTVIDHIPAGLGLTILRQFKLLHYGHAVTVGFNLPSQSQGSKDIIKIKNVQFSEQDANRLALFSPNAVVNQICLLYTSP
ncbi:aspartate carbamoyltransferase regulatory subunit, partial [Kingella kingae]|uniref:aspartate carbamoyltransferase regulatory subunit n=1 Tax=Kingella kingae TaxID=504 RepID=UPI002550F541